jgi:hypothetical protein
MSEAAKLRTVLDGLPNQELALPAPALLVETRRACPVRPKPWHSRHCASQPLVVLNASLRAIWIRELEYIFDCSSTIID